MLGTLVNAAAILLGGAAGLLLKNGLKENFRDILNQAVSLAVVFVGLGGCVGNMLASGAHPVLFIVSLALGGLLGEGLRIEARLEGLGNWLQAKVQKNGGGGGFSKGFVAGSLVFCVGTMAVLGSLESGMQGNHSILFAKSLLDGIIALVMAGTLGVGVVFSAGSVLVYQGVLTALASLLSPFVTGDMLREIGIVGGILICAIGLNMLGVTRIRTGNLLPALLGPVVYYAVAGLLG
ncbi:DUF554 domain-containing protein [Ruminococcaceae bacterium OttesenSCG-928-O06]|nr:DUF554 domain-containing protein [Ruminococcaceae bacterium OttesenSCG-928-O06]